MQTSSKDFTADVVCTTLPFVLKYQDFGAPEASSGTALFCLYDKNYDCEYVTPFYAVWHRARQVGLGLAALHYEMLPTVGQVVCKHPNRLLSEAAARRATVRWAAVR